MGEAAHKFDRPGEHSGMYACGAGRRFTPVRSLTPAIATRCNRRRGECRCEVAPTPCFTFDGFKSAVLSFEIDRCPEYGAKAARVWLARGQSGHAVTEGIKSAFDTSARLRVDHGRSVLDMLGWARAGTAFVLAPLNSVNSRLTSERLPRTLLTDSASALSRFGG